MDGGAWKAAIHGVAEGRTGLSKFTFTFHFHALEKEMATHSSVLASICSNVLSDLSPAAASKSCQSCPTLCDPIDSSPPGSHPWDSPGKNTRVGCHFLLQCIKVKSESELAQSCPPLHDPMDCSLPGSSVHGIFQARVLEWVAIAFSGPFS